MDLLVGPRRVVISRDGSRIAAFGMTPDSGTENWFRIWDVSTGTVIREFRIRDLDTMQWDRDGMRMTGVGLLGFDRKGEDLLCAVSDHRSTGGAGRKPPGMPRSPEHGAISTSIQSVRIGRGSVRWKLPLQTAFPSADLAVSPDGRTGLVVGDLRSLWLVDLKEGKNLRKLSPPPGMLSTRQTTFSPDGKLVALSSYEKGSFLVDVESGKVQVQLSGIEAEVSAHAFSPDGKKLAVACNDASVELWDIASGKRDWRIGGGWTPRLPVPSLALAFSPDGKRIATCGLDNAIHVLDAATGKETVPEDDHTSHIASLTFSPDGKTLATAGGDGTVRLWDAKGRVATDVLRHHEDAVRSVAFSPDGSLMASGGGDNRVIITERSTGEKDKVWELNLPDDGRKKPDSVHTVRFSPDGTRLLAVSSHGTGILMKVDRAKMAALSEGKGIGRGFGQGSSMGRDPILMDVFWEWNGPWGEVGAFTPDGKLLVYQSASDRIRVCEAKTGRPKRILPAGAGDVSCLAISSDSKRIVTGNNKGEARIMDIIRGREIRKWQACPLIVTAITYSPDGRIIATAGAMGKIRLWSADDGELIAERTGHEDGVLALAFSPDGNVLASGGLDGVVYLWHGPEVR
jgi:WD40 repeat protein